MAPRQEQGRGRCAVRRGELRLGEEKLRKRVARGEGTVVGTGGRSGDKINPFTVSPGRQPAFML